MSRAQATPSRAEVSVRASWRWLTLILLAAATIAAFRGVAGADWILFDDPAYALRNPHVAGGLTLDGFRWMFTHPHGGNFHPLTTLSHMLDCEVFGLDPRGPHLVNLGLHVANALLVCTVLSAYTGAWWRSAFVAAFFALHPLRVESVAWISERKDVLSTLCFLLALAAYRRWTVRPTRARYGLLLAAFVLGLLAKPMLVTLPFVLLLLDVWPLGRARWPLIGRDAWPRWREKSPLFALAFASSVVTYVVQDAAGAVMDSQAHTLGPRLANALVAYARYLELTIAPHDLAVYYPLALATPTYRVLGAAAVLALATVCAWRLRERRPSVLVGWLWFLGTLVPVIGIVQVGAQALADRYTYIPSIGLGIAAVWIVSDVAARSASARIVVPATAAAALAICGVATARQTARWKDTRTLFAHTLAVTEPNAVAHQNLGNALFAAGEVDAAIVHFEQALRLVPDLLEAHNDLGSALGSLGRHAEAIEHFRAALRARETAETHQNLGWALEHSGRSDDAIPEYEAALRIDGDFAAAHAKLGALLAARGRLDEAGAHLQRALELEPGEIETLRSMAIVRTLQGRVEEGIAAYDALLVRAPRDLDALNNIAWIRATHAEAAHRDGAQAVRLAELARDAAAGENDVLCSTLAAAYAEAGRFEDAVRVATRAIEIARARGDERGASNFAAQLALYRAGRPFHQ